MGRDAIAIDFDGTLCVNAYPEIGEPIHRVIEKAKKRKAEGAGLILWTCREGERLQNAIDWCKQQGLEFDAVNESLPEWLEMFGTAPRKIGATEYWDDRAVNPINQPVCCGECKHYHKDTGYCKIHSYFFEEEGVSCSPAESPTWTMFDEDDYCSDGERKDAENGNIT